MKTNMNFDPSIKLICETAKYFNRSKHHQQLLSDLVLEIRIDKLMTKMCSVIKISDILSLTMEKIRLLCNMTFFLLGFLIDKVFGIRLGAVIFATFICLGKIKYYLKSIVFSPINIFWIFIPPVGRMPYCVN